jgi:hypothetical protein
MKKIGLMALAGMLLHSPSLCAQVWKPVTWSFSARRTGPCSATLLFTATINDDWHVYSLHVREGGPVPTKFTFESSDDFILDSAMAEPHPIMRKEPAFHMVLGYFVQSVVFQQRIRLRADEVKVRGQVEFMTGNGTRCLPPEGVDFSIAVK